MFEFMIGAVVGLVIGWNVLPQPAWAADLYTRWFGK
jgi:hypothetical protein